MSVNTGLKPNPDAITRGVIAYIQVEAAAAAADFYKTACGRRAIARAGPGREADERPIGN